MAPTVGRTVRRREKDRTSRGNRSNWVSSSDTGPGYTILPPDFSDLTSAPVLLSTSLFGNSLHTIFHRRARVTMKSKQPFAL